MRILIAPDSFKDALRAIMAANAITEGIGYTLDDNAYECDVCPVSDGGEGFVSAMSVGLTEARLHLVNATDPLSKPIRACYALAPAVDGQASIAVIELADASGLERLALHERDPTRTSTFGTGTLLGHALDHGAERILLGIGGSATTDAGCGIVQALGGVFFDIKGRAIERPVTGADLACIGRIDLIAARERLAGRTIRIACDVTNPLYGKNGAAYIYGPQKGATPEQVEQLDTGLRAIAAVWRGAGLPDVAELPGSGAAGGVGGGLVAMLGAELCPGAELVLDAVGFDARVAKADLVITGEGRLDRQSLQGKAAMAVAARAMRAGVPCVALVGSVGEGADEALDHGLTSYHVIGEGLAPEDSIARTAELLAKAAAQIVVDYAP